MTAGDSRCASMAYRWFNNVINDAVITFVDITAAEKLESRFRLDAKN